MNNRTAIKQAIKAILTAKKDDEFQTVAEDRVFTNRFLPVPATDEDYQLPAICVYTLEESVTDQDNITQKRVLDLVIECLAEDPDDTVIDDFTNQVESLLVQDETAGGVACEITLSRTSIAYDEESKTDFRAAKLTYTATYFTEKTADSPTDDFQTAHVDYNDGAFSDTITLPTE